jgi:hypothetical protein
VGEDLWKPEIARLRHQHGAWKLTLDAHSRIGVPGFRGSFVMGPIDPAAGEAGADRD